MNELINFSEIVHPYRPDITIRIDFLQWFYEKKNRFSINKNTLTKHDILKNKDFFEAARQHPYFFNFTRKHRYRKFNLSREKSEQVYAEGIAEFINLLNSIKKNGYDKKQKIRVRRCFFLKKPDYGEKIKRKYYIGDGCHRFACIAWLDKNNLFSKELFKIEYKFSLKPVNSFGILKKLRIFNDEDEKIFDKLFNSKRPLDWNEILKWISGVRERFKSVNHDELFKIKFSK